jgi:hypothetical protein
VELTDPELIDRVLAGDVEAYAPLVAPHPEAHARDPMRMLGLVARRRFEELT